MNKAAIKKYAPAARKAFIAAVTRRAELLGLDPGAPPSIEHDGDVMLINGRAFSAQIESQRDALEQRIAREGFDVVMDAMAYTWFNRLVAIRYMELHGYLGHGYRVLSHPDDSDGQHNQPEILDHLTDIEMPGLDKAHALDLKLAGNRDEDLYREVLLAQCHALHTAMPFLFEPIDDATELLLPDGLLRTDSLVRQLVTAIDEESWQQVEIIGWLYQFYISEKKDQVIGKVVKSEDIPAATQLFTPNWIVKYLVQNSLGRLWLMANPNSQLASKWEYYIQPAEQTPEVNAQLDALIQARIAEDGSTLNPETLTLLDPACGSGHILVEAYDLLRDIYLERGYRRRDIPRLILEKNLYGLEIDERAAQLAGFALLMKARADDRLLFVTPIALNVHSFRKTSSKEARELHRALSVTEIDHDSASRLTATFERTKTVGSLTQIPEELSRQLPLLRPQLYSVHATGNLFESKAAALLLQLLCQAEVLSDTFDAVVTNPPYMGSRGMNPELKGWTEKSYPSSKADLFAMFIERGFGWCKELGFNSMVTMQSWMFLARYEDMRSQLLAYRTISSMAHLGPRAFSEISGEVVQTTAFVSLANHIAGYRPVFHRLTGGKEDDKSQALRAGEFRHDEAAQDDFKKIPGNPIAYWIPADARKTFSSNKSFRDFATPVVGLNTGNNDRFLRLWHEVSLQSINFSCDSIEAADAIREKWLPYNKGGSYRKWYGNNSFIINWRNAGEEVKALARKRNAGKHWSRYIQNLQWMCKPGVTWSATSSSSFGARYSEPGFLFDVKGTSAFPKNVNPYVMIGFLTSRMANKFLEYLNPTIEFQTRDIANLPFATELARDEGLSAACQRCVEIHKYDWDAFETSWDFTKPPLVEAERNSIRRIKDCYDKHITENNRVITEAKQLEELIDRRIYRAHGLFNWSKEPRQDYELTLNINPAYRYGYHIEEQRAVERFRGDCTKEILSYSIGCMMGRYSIDNPGLIYACAGNEGFNPSHYTTFPADDDGIVPITDEAWFDDDGANRIREFVRVVWGEDTEAENMAWLAESLGSKGSESADDTIRRYLSKGFYKDHLQTYKKRPIYWLFSSGKHKAFEALVYLHRYNAGTLSRMRMQYVVPLQSKMQSRIDRLDEDVQSSSSSAEQKRLQKQRDKLAKQLDELRRFDEELRHYADQRITLDLDDGVKVNYGKFGNLLAEVKTVTGSKA